MTAMIDLSGKRVGILTVLGQADRWPYWTVRCDCGVEKRVRGDHLRSGRTISCGCEHARRASARVSALHRANVTHGMTGTRIHSIWFGMKQRCLNPNSKHFNSYGGRGIAVCERWMTFENFLADMGEPGPGMTLERINNGGNYEPDNCCWATRLVQMNNRRVCRHFTARGETHTLSEWSRISGIHRNTLDQRIATGETIEEALRPERRVNMDQLAIAIRNSSIARKARTHCKRGHEFTPENTGKQKWGRYCRVCHREKVAAQAAAKRLAAHR